MVMDTDYSDHDAYQQAVANGARAVVRNAALSAAETCGSDDAIVLVDYGCATSPHADLIRAAIDAIRSKRPSASIAVVHNDLPTNDWNALFSAATDPSRGYTSGLIPSPLPMAAAGSFYAPVVPKGLASLGISFSAAHWLRNQPKIDAGSWCMADAREPAAGELASRAAADWECFLSARAHDLRPGGMLVVECMGVLVDGENGTRHVTARKVFERMRRAALDLVEEGLLRRQVVDEFVFPTAMRGVEEARAPLVSGPLSRAFDVVDISVRPAPHPFLRLLEERGPDWYAREYAATVRVFTSSTLLEHLFSAGAVGIEPHSLHDRYFSHLQEMVARDPSVPLDSWELQVVLRRR